MLNSFFILKKTRPFDLFEFDALSQRKLVPVIDRDRRTSHVMFPRIASALAASAGGLFTAERTAYLGTAGADVDVDYSAI